MVFSRVKHVKRLCAYYFCHRVCTPCFGFYTSGTPHLHYGVSTLFVCCCFLGVGVGADSQSFVQLVDAKGVVCVRASSCESSNPLTLVCEPLSNPRS